MRRIAFVLKLTGDRAALLRLMHALVPTFRAADEVNREAEERLERKAAI